MLFPQDRGIESVPFHQVPRSSGVGPLHLSPCLPCPRRILGNVSCPHGRARSMCSGYSTGCPSLPLQTVQEAQDQNDVALLAQRNDAVAEDAVVQVLGSRIKGSVWCIA
jgi:hypothetical protein